MDHTVPIRFSAYVGMDIGRDNGGVVDLAYEDRKPFAFTGTVKKVVFDISRTCRTTTSWGCAPSRTAGARRTVCRARSREEIRWRRSPRTC